MKKGFTLSHLYIRSSPPKGDLTPLRSGLVFVSNEIPDYLDQYDGWTRRDLEDSQYQLRGSEVIDGMPQFHFECSISTLQFGIKMKKFLKGRYLTIKMIDSFHDDLDTTTMGMTVLGIVGFKGIEQETFDLGPIPKYLGLAMPQLRSVVRKGNYDDVEDLLAQGFYPEEVQDETRRLFDEDLVDLEMLSIFINVGVDLKKVTPKGKDPAWLAFRHGPEKVDVELLSLFVDSRVKMNYKDDDGSTPLHQLVSNTSVDLTAVQLVIKGGGDVNARDSEECTPLVVSCRVGATIFVVNELLKAGANLNVSGNDGMTPLMWAVALCQQDLTQLLINRGASVDYVHPTRGISALTLAGVRRHHPIVALLLQEGCVVPHLELPPLEVFFGGDASSGQHGELFDVTYDGSFRESNSLKHSKIVNVSAGSNHVLLLTSDGIVYVCGQNAHGQCALPPQQQQQQQQQQQPKEEEKEEEDGGGFFVTGIDAERDDDDNNRIIDDDIVHFTRLNLSTT